MVIKNKTDNEIWKEIKFCVFDAPNHPGPYLERYSYAQDVIRRSGCISSFSIPIEICSGLDHLKSTLKEISNRKGEGIMLYHPDESYVSGRTNNLLKVKDYKETDVMFLKTNKNSYSYICEQQNGKTCIVKCSGWDYQNPPLPGTVLNVRHNGFYKTSQKLKYPLLRLIRYDLDWIDIKECKKMHY